MICLRSAKSRAGIRQLKCAERVGQQHALHDLRALMEEVDQGLWDSDESGDSSDDGGPLFDMHNFKFDPAFLVY